MKILFIVPYPTEGPSNRFRVEQYLPYLREKGIFYSLRPFYNRYIYKILYKKGYYIRKAFFLLFFILSRIRDVFTAKFYDIVFIHREAYPFAGWIFEYLFRIFGKKIIYDFDDAIFLKKPLKIKKTISSSDYIIAGNEFLRRYAIRYNKNVFTFPTCINTEIYVPNKKEPDRERVILGWIGTASTVIYLVILKEVYKILADRFKNLEFRIIGGNFINSDLPIVYRDWSLASEVKELQEFDIGVMPLFDDDWARGKCAFKIIQYMAVGIPSVASRVGMNVEIIEDGRDGFLAGSADEWVEKLSILIQDRQLREKMGSLARIKIQNLYSIKSNKEKYINILEKTYYLKR